MYQSFEKPLKQSVFTFLPLQNRGLQITQLIFKVKLDHIDMRTQLDIKGYPFFHICFSCFSISISLVLPFFSFTFQNKIKKKPAFIYNSTFSPIGASANQAVIFLLFLRCRQISHKQVYKNKRFYLSLKFLWCELLHLYFKLKFSSNLCIHIFLISLFSENILRKKQRNVQLR